MRLAVLILSLVTFGCAGAAPGPATPEPKTRIVYCSATVTHWDEERCIRELTPEQQRRRWQSYRLGYEGNRLVEFAAVDGRGELVENNDTRCAVVRYEWRDDRIAGGSCRDRMGFARTRFRLRGTSSDWLDAWGRPQQRNESQATGLIRRFDATGRVTGFRYVDAKGAAVPNKDGAFEIRVRRDRLGQLTGESFFGKDGEPIVNVHGVHRVEYRPDGFGGRLEERFFGADGKPATHKNGYHRVSIREDDAGNDIEVSYFDIAGRPARFQGKYHHALRYQRDARGAPVQVSYHDASGKLTPNDYGYAIQRRVLDAQGRIVERSHFDANQRAVARKEGNHRTVTVYDRDGNVLSETFFDVRGAKIVTTDGFATVRYTRDARGNEIGRAFFGARDEPILHTSGYHAREWARDSFDAVTEVAWRGTDGKPINGPWGYAREVMKRASDGTVESSRYYDAAGQEVTVAKYVIAAIRFRDGDASARQAAEDLAQRLHALLQQGRTLEASADALGVKVETLTMVRETLVEGLRALEPGQISGVVLNKTTFFVARRDQ